MAVTFRRRNGDDSTRWVRPFEDQEFSVNMRRLPQEERSRILDRHNVLQKPTFEKYARANRDFCRYQVVGWQGEELLFGSPTPCTEENKMRLATDEFPVFDESEQEKGEVPVWIYLSKKFDEAEAADIKN